MCAWREDDGVDLGDRQREPTVLRLALLPAALEQAAVEQDGAAAARTMWQ
jgi:hypothetical protein